MHTCRKTDNVQQRPLDHHYPDIDTDIDSHYLFKPIAVEILWVSKHLLATSS